MSFIRAIATTAALALPLTATNAHAEDASRVVAIGGAVTEIIYALGEQDRLIARDTTSIFPPEVLALPDVGYMRALAPEGVLSVSPDLILAEPGAGPPETLDILTAAEISFISVPGDYDAQGVIDRVISVADALGVQEKGAALAASLKEELDAVAKATTNAATHPRVLFVLSMPGGRMNVAGENTRSDAVIRMAGAVNVAAEFEGYKTVSDEALVRMAPDVVMMMNQAGGRGVSEDDLWAHPGLMLTPAGENKRLIQMDGAYLLGFGPRTGAAVTDLRRAFDEISGAEG